MKILSQSIIFCQTEASVQQSWTCCAEERKSAIFFVAPQRKLRFSKAQLRFLHFKLFDATFIHNFYHWIWYGGFIKSALIAWWLSLALGNLVIWKSVFKSCESKNLSGFELSFLIKLRLRSLRFTSFFGENLRSYLALQ
jgi:hypothetical protein